MRSTHQRFNANASVLDNGSLVVVDRAYGAAPVGVLTYTTEGYMSANIMATEPEFRPPGLTFPFQDNQSDADWALVGKQYVE